MTSSRKQKVKKKGSDITSIPDAAAIQGSTLSDFFIIPLLCLIAAIKLISVGLDAAIGDFCAGLENLCGRAEMNDDDREESEWLPLPLADIRVLVNDIVSIRAKNFLHLVPVDILVRTLRVLDHQIHRAEGLSINECEHVSLRFCIHMLLVVDVYCTQELRYIDWITFALLPYKLYICVYAMNSSICNDLSNLCSCLLISPTRGCN